LNTFLVVLIFYLLICLTHLKILIIMTLKMILRMNLKNQKT